MTATCGPRPRCWLRSTISTSTRSVGGFVQKPLIGDGQVRNGTPRMATTKIQRFHGSTPYRLSSLGAASNRKVEPRFGTGETPVAHARG